jgi:hypothetical protein
MFAAFIGDAQGNLHAQGKLDARYEVSLGGIPLGKGAWTIDVGHDRFTAAASGGTGGLLRLIATGQGTSASRGSVQNGQLISSSFSSNIQSKGRVDDVRMVLSGGTVKEFSVDPPPGPAPDFVPLTEAHRRGVTDPMTGALSRVPGNGDTFSSEACLRKVAVFDGRMRYDLSSSFKRLERVRSERGYQGTVVVCAVYFTPIAGYNTGRRVIKYLADMRDIEVWLAPIAGTRLMVPYRATIPTPFGVGVMQATQFVSEPYPQRATSNGLRAQ